MEDINKLTEQVLKYAFQVHSGLGPGLLESAYKECLFYELNKNGIYTEKEKALPLVYQEVKMEIGYRVDLLVENRLIVEIKAVESLTDVHTAQVLTYLKLSKCTIGLLLNFNTAKLKNGIKRLIYNYSNNSIKALCEIPLCFSVVKKLQNRQIKK